MVGLDRLGVSSNGGDELGTHGDHGALVGEEMGKRGRGARGGMGSKGGGRGRLLLQEEAEQGGRRGVEVVRCKHGEVRSSTEPSVATAMGKKTKLQKGPR